MGLSPVEIPNSTSSRYACATSVLWVGGRVGKSARAYLHGVLQQPCGDNLGALCGAPGVHCQSGHHKVRTYMAMPHCHLGPKAFSRQACADWEILCVRMTGRRASSSRCWLVEFCFGGSQTINIRASVSTEGGRARRACRCICAAAQSPLEQTPM